MVQGSRIQSLEDALNLNKKVAGMYFAHNHGTPTSLYSGLRRKLCLDDESKWPVTDMGENVRKSLHVN